MGWPMSVPTHDEWLWHPFCGIRFETTWTSLPLLMQLSPPKQQVDRPCGILAIAANWTSLTSHVAMGQNPKRTPVNINQSNH